MGLARKPESGLGAEILPRPHYESLLIGLVGARMDEATRGFSRSESPSQFLARVTRVGDGLIQGVESYLEDRPPPRMAELMDKLT